MREGAMRPYFEKMPRFGRALTDRQIADAAENIEAITAFLERRQPDFSKC